MLPCFVGHEANKEFTEFSKFNATNVSNTELKWYILYKKIK